MLQLLNRLKEPSPHAGLAVLLGLVGVPHAPEIMGGAMQIATGLFGLVAVLMPERVK